jgi:integrase
MPVETRFFGSFKLLHALSLRHFYASMLIAENKDLKMIQERLGHVYAAMARFIKERQAKAREEEGGILGRVLSQDHGIAALCPL